MKIFLGNPPWRKEGRLGVRAGSRWPFTMSEPDDVDVPGYLPFPFYLAYATAILEKEGFEVKLLDAVAEGMKFDTFEAEVARFQPDLLVMETSTPSFNSDMEIAQILKPHVGRIVLCGPHVSSRPEEVLRENKVLDFALLGEYEPVLLDLVRALSENKPLGNIEGMVWRDGDQIRHNGKRKLIKDVNWYPWPAREYLPMHRYRDNFAGMPEPSLQMWASRGCPYTCIFCLWPAVMYESRSYRPRDPADVAEEMAFAVKKYDMKSVFFDDDTFNIGKPRMVKLAEEIKKRDINVPWAMMARADLVDPELLEALTSAGLFAAKYGIESGNQDIVNNSEKKLDLRKAEEGIRLTKAYGVKVHLTFSFGLPGETWDTVRQTIDYALRMDPETLQFSINTPFPGTPYYDLAIKNGLLSAKSTDDFDGWKSAVIRTEEMSGNELETALEMAHEAWERAVMWRTLRREPVKMLGKAIRNPKKAMDILYNRVSTGGVRVGV